MFVVIEVDIFDGFILVLLIVWEAMVVGVVVNSRLVEAVFLSDVAVIEVIIVTAVVVVVVIFAEVVVVDMSE